MGDERLERALVELDDLLKKWEVDDYVVVTPIFHFLLGRRFYKRDNINVIVKEFSLPWKEEFEGMYSFIFEVVPPEDTIWFEDYQMFVNRTGYTVEFVILKKEDYEKFGYVEVNIHDKKIKIRSLEDYPKELRELLKTFRYHREKIRRLGIVYTNLSKYLKRIGNDIWKDFYDVGREYLEEYKKRYLTLYGIPVYPGVVSGKTYIVEDPWDLERLREGSGILITDYVPPQGVYYLKRYSGIILGEGDLLTPAARAARKYWIPCVVNVKDIVLKKPEFVKLDGGRGVVEIIDREVEELLSEV